MRRPLDGDAYQSAALAQKMPNIPRPEHPTSNTSHIPNILHPKHPTHPTSQIFHIPNIPHTEHATSQISHIPNVPRLKYPTSQTSHIPKIPPPEHPTSRTALIQKEHCTFQTCHILDRKIIVSLLLSFYQSSITRISSAFSSKFRTDTNIKQSFNNIRFQKQWTTIGMKYTFFIV